MKTNVILIQKDSKRRLNVSTKRNWIEAIELHFCNNRQFCNNSITQESFIRNRYVKLIQYDQTFDIIWRIVRGISFRKLFCTRLKGWMTLTIWWKYLPQLYFLNQRCPPIFWYLHLLGLALDTPLCPFCSHPCHYPKWDFYER